MHCFPIQDLFYFAFRYLSDKNMFILCLNLTSAHFLGITKYVDKIWHSDSSKDYLRVTRASTRMYSIKRKCSRVTKFLSRRQEEVEILSTNCQCRLSTGIRVRTPTRPHRPYVKLRNYQIRLKMNCFFSANDTLPNTFLAKLLPGMRSSIRSISPIRTNIGDHIYCPYLYL